LPTSVNTIKRRAKNLVVSPGSGHEMIRRLIIDGVLDRPISSAEVVRAIRENCGVAWSTTIVQTYMKKFLDVQIVRAVKSTNGRHNFWVLSATSREEALRILGKNQNSTEQQMDPLPETLMAKLGKDFRQELGELRGTFGVHGLCTAFLLRRILEKLIVIVFGKNQRESLLEDQTKPGGRKGLKEMIETAAREKSNGIPFLTGHTVRKIEGVRFLGDTAAHNPLVGVDVKTIAHQMPFIITAYEELAGRL